MPGLIKRERLARTPSPLEICLKPPLTINVLARTRMQTLQHNLALNIGEPQAVSESSQAKQKKESKSKRAGKRFDH